MKSRLTPDDWIKASFRALTLGGPQAIRAESIARALKVSKGSFYWHFADVPALKQAMLDHWQKLATQDIIDMVEAGANDAPSRLRLLVQISTASHPDPYGGVQAEAAIRDWARYDANAAKALRSVDQKRLEFVQTLFRAHGTPPTDCKSHANILYAALIGLNHLSHHGLSTPAVDLEALLELLLHT